jgi:hypothetical protein
VGAGLASATILTALWFGLSGSNPPAPISSRAPQTVKPTPKVDVPSATALATLIRDGGVIEGRIKRDTERAASLAEKLTQLNRRIADPSTSQREQARLNAQRAARTAELAATRAQINALEVSLRRTNKLIARARTLIASSIIGGDNGKGALPAPIDIQETQGIRFDPPPPGTEPALTASEALARFQSVDEEFVLPVGADAYLGRYTAPVGDGTFRFRERLAWGFRLGSGCPVGAGFGPPHAASNSGPCFRWLFLDANTGEMLESVTQH